MRKSNFNLSNSISGRAYIYDGSICSKTPFEIESLAPINEVKDIMKPNMEYIADPDETPPFGSTLFVMLPF